MNKSVIFSLFLMASLLMGTSLNMNMFSTAMADGKDKDDKYLQSHMNQIHMQIVMIKSYGYNTQL